jgi:hypothetical protein
MGAPAKDARPIMKVDMPSIDDNFTGTFQTVSEFVASEFVWRSGILGQIWGRVVFVVRTEKERDDLQAKIPQDKDTPFAIEIKPEQAWWMLRM